MASMIWPHLGVRGVWIRLNNKPWNRVSAGTQGLRAGDLDGDGKDELIANLGREGLWARYNNSRWVKLQPASPIRLATGDLDGNGQDELMPSSAEEFSCATTTPLRS